MPATILIMDTEAERYVAGIAGTGLPLHAIAARTPDEAMRRGAEAEIFAALAPFVTQGVIDAMPGLRWIQALTTGTDQLEKLRLPAGVLVTSARGVHGPQMAELAFLHMLALYRNYRAMLENQGLGVWRRWPQRLLFGKTATIVGVGTISEELASRCHAFGMRVVGISDGRETAPGFDAVLPRSKLKEAAAEADFLIVLAPYTRATHHLIDAAVLHAMRTDAFLINIARGSVVDESALIEALADGTIAGAGLDVFETEPLPANSPLWPMRNVMVTPHVGGMSDTYPAQVLPLILDNLRHYLAGDIHAMRNIVQSA
jgi:phosphoglycerate dehydrogenase-like enzyme